jgi:hypothetical protein
LAGYTYGPLLGLFAFGILTKRKINDRASIWVCIVAPLLVLGIDILNNAEWFIHKLSLDKSTADSLKEASLTIFSGFRIGIELLILNGFFTFLGLYLLSKNSNTSVKP